MTAANSLESISIVLVKTSHPGNVGSVARAMKTMGLHDLRLVCPKFDAICTAPEAIALASGAQDVLQQARIYNTLSDALSDRSCAFALSSRLRNLGPPLQNPQEAAIDALRIAHVGVAFVFGAERTGLSNEEILLCNRQVMIAANPAYSSLNLSQAVQIICYALRTQWLATATDSVNNVLSGGPPVSSKLASVKAVEDLKVHWLEAMQAVDFINPEKPNKVLQRLTRLLSRMPLEQTEVDMLRGFLADVVRVADGRLYPHELSRKKP